MLDKDLKDNQESCSQNVRPIGKEVSSMTENNDFIIDDYLGAAANLTAEQQENVSHSTESNVRHLEQLHNNFKQFETGPGKSGKVERLRAGLGEKGNLFHDTDNIPKLSKGLVEESKGSGKSISVREVGILFKLHEEEYKTEEERQNHGETGLKICQNLFDDKRNLLTGDKRHFAFTNRHQFGILNETLTVKPSGSGAGENLFQIPLTSPTDDDQKGQQPGWGCNLETEKGACSKNVYNCGRDKNDSNDENPLAENFQDVDMNDIRGDDNFSRPEIDYEMETDQEKASTVEINILSSNTEGYFKHKTLPLNGQMETDFDINERVDGFGAVVKKETDDHFDRNINVNKERESRSNYFAFANSVKNNVHKYSNLNLFKSNCKTFLNNEDSDKESELLCGLCSKRFSQKSDLRKHFVSHLHNPNGCQNNTVSDDIMPDDVDNFDDVSEEETVNYSKLFGRFGNRTDTEIEQDDTNLANEQNDTIHSCKTVVGHLIDDIVNSAHEMMMRGMGDKVCHDKMTAGNSDTTSPEATTDSDNSLMQVCVDMTQGKSTKKSSITVENRDNKDHTKSLCKKKYIDNLCDICGKAFPSLKSLESHCLVHTGGFSHYCNICGKGFKQQSNMNTHLRTHMVERPLYHCDICGQSRFVMQSLVAHIRGHLGIFSFECEQCGKGFSAENRLKMHMENVHLGVRKFSCSQCDKAFKSKGNLKEHYRVHTKEKKFSCDICNKNFGTKGYLKRHSRLHTGEEMFKCDICNYMSFEKGNVRRHMAIHESNSYQCEFCNKTFTNKDSFRNHKHFEHTHPESKFKCDLCSKAFISNDLFRCHMQKHLNRLDFACEICGKKFDNQRSLRDHTRYVHGEQSTACDICGKKFKHNSSVSRHVKEVHMGKRPKKKDSFHEIAESSA